MYGTLTFELSSLGLILDLMINPTLDWCFIGIASISMPYIRRNMKLGTNQLASISD